MNDLLKLADEIEGAVAISQSATGRCDELLLHWAAQIRRIHFNQHQIISLFLREMNG